jgi:putative FmdB family regulatory protein
MPIFEYDCARCGVSFEKLERSSANAEKVTCPHCNSRKVKRRISTFAHNVTGGSSTPRSEGSSCSSGGSCGGCKGCGNQH